MNYPVVTLKKARDFPIVRGEPWVFSGAVAMCDPNVEDGSIVNVCSHKGKFLGTGYYNSKSQIQVRILTNIEEPVSTEFFEKKIRTALALRKPFVENSNTNAFRLIHSESDGIPGLCADVYDNFIVLQSHTLGIDCLKNIIVKAFNNVFLNYSIFERSDVNARANEGVLTRPVGVLTGQNPPDNIKIMENGLYFSVDIKNGQKTGFFLDQKENREWIRNISKDLLVLNLFSFSGGFTVYSAKGGARETVSVDCDESALRQSIQNLELNGIDIQNHVHEHSDCFEYLSFARKENMEFDVIIVDPPAFAKHRGNISNALRGYEDLNYAAMRVLKKPGIILSCSCSSVVSNEDFLKSLQKSAGRLNRKVKIIRESFHPYDHPYDPLFPQGKYLKGYGLFVS